MHNEAVSFITETMNFFYISKSQASINLAQIIKVEWGMSEGSLSAYVHLLPDPQDKPNTKSVDGEDAAALWTVMHPDREPPTKDQFLTMFERYKGAL